MEPVSQALLGAASAEVVAGRRLGRRALLWGALVGMSPDLDVLAAPLHDGFGEWLYHRGTTHSLWFGFVLGPALGWALWRWRDRRRETPLGAWIALAIAALVTHPILDGFTPYGTQLFAPFWRERFAWNGVGIIDPFYTLPLAAGVAAAAWSRDERTRGRRRLVAALGVTTAYLFAGVGLNAWAEHEVRTAFAQERIPLERVRAYPTVLQPWLRAFVARAGDRVFVGWHTPLAPGCPSWRERDDRARSSPRVQEVLDTWEGGLLAWFADGEIGVAEERDPDGSRVRIDDLRYAWGSPEGLGMWGVEARFDAAGRRVGPVRRFSRREASPRDTGALFAAMTGRLPGAAVGWVLPADCTLADRIAGRSGHPNRDPVRTGRAG